MMYIVDSGGGVNFLFYSDQDCGYLVSVIPDPADEYSSSPLTTNTGKQQGLFNEIKNTFDLLSNIITLLKIHPFYCRLQMYFIIVYRFL